MKRLITIFAFLALNLFSTTYYVDSAKPDNSGNGTSWATAKQTIQAAVDISSDTDMILVTNGIYNVGKTITTGYGSYNRVYVDKNILIKSFNGPEVTIIQGSGTNHVATAEAIRCVYLKNGVLDGFTLLDGATPYAGDYDYDRDRTGGGINAYAHSAGSYITNCLIINNISRICAGGSSVVVYGCTVTNNTVAGDSGVAGLEFCTIYNSLIAYNNPGEGEFIPAVLMGEIYNSEVSYQDCIGMSAYGPGSYVSNCVFRHNARGGIAGCNVEDSSIVNNGNVNLQILSSEFVGGGYTAGSGYQSWIKNSYILVNKSINGAGCFSIGSGYESGSSYATNCQIGGNIALNGGGSFNLPLYDCVVNGNYATNGAGCYFGQLGEFYPPALPVLRNCKINNNEAQTGGGVYIYGRFYEGNDIFTNGIIDNCVFSNNVASYNGGGIYDDRTRYTLTVSNSKITHNTANGSDAEESWTNYGGGGIYSAATTSKTVIVSCRIKDNKVTNYGSGGGVCSVNSNAVEIINCVVSTNSAWIGGGISRVNSFSSSIGHNIATFAGGCLGPSFLVNTAIDSNTATFYGDFWTNIEENVNFIPVGTNCCSTTEFFFGLSNVLSSAGFTNSDLMVDLESSVRNAGENYYQKTETDIDGNYRITEGRIDIGAYEFLSYFVTLSVTGGTGSGEYLFMSVVNISASETNDTRFLTWIGNTNSIQNITNKNTSLVMTDNISITSEFNYASYVLLNVTNFNLTYGFEEIEYTNDLYKTTYIVLKKIEKGSGILGSKTNELGRDPRTEKEKESVLTNSFYMGIYEITQNQWEEVCGNTPSFFTNVLYKDTRPVEMISYDMARGSVNQGANWPLNTNVYSESFIGILQSETGLNFDLPTEHQWEYACRGGTRTALNNNQDLYNVRYDTNLLTLARYYPSLYNRNSDVSKGTSKVGSYLPNAYGLYDMHGNVWEWCLDWYSPDRPDLILTNYVGPSSGTYRVLKSGAWGYYAKMNRSGYRTAAPSFSTNFYDGMGLRIVLPVESEETIKYQLTVNDGTGSGEYYKGQHIEITTTVPEDKVFDSWQKSTANLGNIWNDYAVSNVLIMPKHNVELTPVFGTKYLNLTYVAVTNGYINGYTNYVQNVEFNTDSIEVIATPMDGYHFSHWTDGVLTSNRIETSVISNCSFYAVFLKNITYLNLSTDLVINQEGTTNIVFVNFSNSIDTNKTVSVSKTGSFLVTNAETLFFTTNDYHVPKEFSVILTDAVYENTNDYAVYTLSVDGFSTNITVTSIDIDIVPNISAYPSNEFGTVSLYPQKIYYRTNDLITVTAYRKAGYGFEGWISDTNETQGNLTNPTNVVFDAETKFYGLFVPTNIVTFFYTNLVYYTEQTNLYKTYFNELPVPTPEDNVTFNGWFTGINGTGIPISTNKLVSSLTDFVVHAYFITQ